MQLKMNVLKKNGNIDNRIISFKHIRTKLKEEYEEVDTELRLLATDYKGADLRNLVRETFDLIQMCILTLDKCNTYAGLIDENKMLELINIEHRDKLKNRGWELGADINIEVKRSRE